MCSEPEVDDCVLVDLAPNIQDWHHHGVHQENEAEEEGHDDTQEQVEDQHEAIVGWASIEYSSFQSQTKEKLECSETSCSTLPVTVEEIKVDQPVETWLVEQKRGDRSPDVKSD